MLKENSYILQVEGKDIINAGEEGYKVSKYKKYKATFDYSLEADKLNELAQSKKIFSRKKDRNMFYTDKYDKQYTNHIVSVKFSYSVKDEKGKTTMKTADIREKLYKDGFDIQGQGHFVRFKRSSGSSRVGKCLFIREELYKDIMEWSYMGLDYSEGIDIDLASIEAYIALTTSSIIDTISIKPHEILLINDYESVFKDTAMATEMYNDNGIMRLRTEPKEVEINNCIWDGQSLLSNEVFEENGYSDKGMLLCRERFFKSACFNTKIQHFFKAAGITEISQLNGKTLATDISQIKLITTPSSIKYLKFGTFEEWINRLEGKFGLVKYEKPTHFYNGDKVQTHYQLLQTLQFDKDTLEDFMSETIDYYNLLKKDIDVFRNHLGIKVNNDNIELDTFNSTNDFMFTLMQLNNDFLKTDLFVNFRSDMLDSFMKDARKAHILINGNYSTLFGNGFEMLRATIKDKDNRFYFHGDSVLPKGKIYSRKFNVGTKIVGCRSPHVTMGNLLLTETVNCCVYSEFFNLSKEIVCVNSIEDNILERLSGADFDSDQMLLTDNKYIVELTEKNYNKFLVPTSLVSAEKVFRKNTYLEKCDLDIKTSVNLIGEIINLSQELNALLWHKVSKGYDIDSKEVQEIYKDISQLDVMSCIEIDKAKKEFEINNKKELDIIRNKYRDYVLVSDKGNEIKSKTKYVLWEEMKALKEDKQNYSYHMKKYNLEGLEEVKVRPYFFQYVMEKEHTKNYEFKRYNTSMDYLQEIIDDNMKGIRSKKRNNIVSFLSLLHSEGIKLSDADRKRIKRTVDDIRKLKIDTNKTWNSDVLDNEEKYLRTSKMKNDLIDKLRGKIKKIETMKKLLVDLFRKEEYSSIVRKTITILFASNKELFTELLKEKQEKLSYISRIYREPKLAEEVIKIYGINYIRKK
ncbi:MAG: hypothetical protein FH753_00920 [Firmicutes bacterium]|nr:hypothetical protein [Bacillota bacterium]